MDNSDEISFKYYIIKLQAIWKFLLSRWIIIVVCGVLGGGLGLLYAFIKSPVYKATSDFVLSSNSSSGGGLMGLASQFGLDLSGSSDNVFSGDNIIVLMESRRMVQEALFKKPEGDNQSLINIFVKDNKLDKAWQKKERTKNAYPFPDSANKMNPVQDSLARSVYNIIQDKQLDVSKPDKNENVYGITTTSKNSEFAYYLTQYLVEVTSSFYINTKTSVAMQSLVMIQHEADSLRGVLGNAITSAGSETDYTFNLNPAYQVQRSGAQQSQARAEALGQAYGQVLQNLEIAKITLQKETPLYQVIDEPTLPLEATRPSKLISLIVGGILGGLLICALLISIRMYKKNRLLKIKLTKIDVRP